MTVGWSSGWSDNCTHNFTHVDHDRASRTVSTSHSYLIIATSVCCRLLALRTLHTPLRHTSWLDITLSFMNCSQFPCLKLSLRNEHYILTEWISCNSLQIYRVSRTICSSCRCNNITVTETHVDNLLVSKFIKLKDCNEDEQHQMNVNNCVNHKQIQIQLSFG